MGEGMVKVSARVSDEQLEFLKREVEKKLSRRIQADISSEVRICIVHRMISLLPKKDKDKLFRKLNMGDEYEDSGRATGECGGVVEEEPAKGSNGAGWGQPEAGDSGQPGNELEDQGSEEPEGN